MNLPSKIAHGVARSTWLTALATIASIVSLGALIFQWLKGSTSLLALFGFIGTTFVFLALNIYSLRVREYAKDLEDVANDFLDINRLYRQTLSSRTSKAGLGWNMKEILDLEKSTLAGVCQRTSQIFSKLTRKDCMVTVKLLTQETTGGSQALFATTYARSQDRCSRDTAEPSRFAVNKGSNTAFDQCLMVDSTGGIPHFFSADLRKHGTYRNERPGHLNCYQSALVVPIRNGPDSQSSDVLGFLAVDTKSRNRLNNGHHLAMLAALADQMYSFISLMRGQHNVPVPEQPHDQ
ncbi:hypothetical protein [Dokdonella koreensis]|uniref:GAF domain-containing protein n=1 Tax=Dokdonella koreensis DS-123 TaxID=1300342 RepID=A0A167GRE3_9GAMM|nr:hypothetical protein [Dokdonella koreensis]ANB17276.1 Hypothetical protein I596_1246 [Dokdonella koreensis DS-123]